MDKITYPVACGLLSLALAGCGWVPPCAGCGTPGSTLPPQFWRQPQIQALEANHPFPHRPQVVVSLHHTRLTTRIYARPAPSWVAPSLRPRIAEVVIFTSRWHYGTARYEQTRWAFAITRHGTILAHRRQGSPASPTATTNP